MNKTVQIWSEPAAGQIESSSLTRLRGLDADGALMLGTSSGSKQSSLGKSA
jgi:hypothetical protein